MLKKLFWIYTIILVLLAVLPINSSGNAINHTFVVSIRLDYLLHCVVYIPWMVLLGLTSKKSFIKDTFTVLFYLLLALVFAFLNEGVQYYLPYRAFNINDLIANFMGVLLGHIIFYFRNFFLKVIKI